MVKIHNYSDDYFYPGNVEGLEEIVLFPGGEHKSKKVVLLELQCMTINTTQIDVTVT